MRPRTLLLWLLGVASTPFVLVLLVVVFAQLNDLQLRIRGYHVMSTGWELGEILATQGDSANECLKFRSPTFDLMTPSRGEHIGMCVRKYAELKKDPSACELLMPSSYGLSCVGAAEDFDPCIMLADDKKTVKGQGLETTYDSCQNGTDKQHVCCAMARVLYDDERNCSSFPQGELRDQCHHIVGVRTNSLDECGFIENPRNRTGCEVIVRAYLTERL